MPGTPPGPGRPPGTLSLKTILKQELAKDDRAEAFVRKTIMDALQGDAAARKLVWEYIEGAPKQSLDVKGTFEHEHYDLRNFTRTDLKELEAIVLRAQSRGNPE